MSTHRRSSLAALVAVALAALSGCASWTQPVGSYDKPAADMAYLYGDFTVAGPESIGMYPTLGLALKCADGGYYAIRFRRTPAGQQFVPVKPSTCTIKELVFASGDNYEKGRKPFGLKYTNDVVLAAGTAYYLGDMTAEATVINNGTTINSSWRLTGISDNYDKTTASLKSAFPNFTAMPTLNLMPPLPAASGATPGAAKQP
jgi:hypothetical protein